MGKLAGVNKRTFTHITHKRLHATVKAFVNGQFAATTEPFITYLTYTWFVTRMNTFVS